VDTLTIERSALRRVLALVFSLLVILFLASPGVKYVVAAQLYEASWGTPVELASITVSKDTVVKGDTSYGAVTIYSAAGWQWDIQKTVDKTVTDAVKGLNEKGYTPIYAKAQAENVTCSLSVYCNYGVRLTTQFHTPQSQQDIETIILIIIILIIIAILFYLVYKGIADIVQYLTTNPVWTALLLIAAITFSIAIIAVVYFNRKKSSS